MLKMVLKDLDQGEEIVKVGEIQELEDFLMEKFPDHLWRGFDLRDMAHILQETGFWDIEVKPYVASRPKYVEDPFDRIHQEDPWPRAADALWTEKK